MNLLDFFHKLRKIFTRKNTITPTRSETTSIQDFSYNTPDRFSTITIHSDSDGNFSASVEPSEFTKSFYLLSEIIEHNKNIYAKIDACEKSFVFLPDFVKNSLELDGDLPPFILCRDKGPILCVRTGQWKKATEFVKTCIAANAYYPEDGSEELAYIQQICNVGQRIVAYVSTHPGSIQKDIYKLVEISPEEKVSARYFLRYNTILRKEPFKNTNRLFLNDSAYSTPKEIK